MSLAELETRTLDGVNRQFDSRVARHYDRLRRVLELIDKSHGAFTTTIGRRLTGWEERSVQRYVNQLEQAGLVTRPPRRTWPYRWSVTQAGKNELQNPLDRVT